MKTVFEEVLRPILLILAIIGFLISGYFIFAKEIKEIHRQKQFMQEQAQRLEEDKEEIASETTTETETETEIETEEVKLPVANNVEEVEGEIPEGFYKDVLFIGDSRTLGLQEYGQVEDATYFSDSGMNVFKLEEKKVKVNGQEMSLEEVLTQRTYKRIYFMIGINELGYDQDKSLAKYEEWVDYVISKQPAAELVIGANLHVTKERSDKDSIFNNANIDDRNNGMREIANKKGLQYIDVNAIFDDENHCLADQYSNDDTHPLGKYYKTWLVWLANYHHYKSE